MFFVLAIAAKAQITGEIYDSDGYPIPLASAIYKGHHVATWTASLPLHDTMVGNSHSVA